MTSFAEEWDASRRQFILRLLVEVGGEANESVIFKGAQHGGFGRDGRDVVRTDLDHLRRHGCTTEEWLNDTWRVVKITERGEDAAHGRIGVAGVERSRWDRK